MRVGYTAAEDYRAERKRLYLEKCEDVIVVREQTDYFNHFISFLKGNKGNEVVVVNIEGINILFTKYVEILDKVTEYNISLTFLNKDHPCDETYLMLLSQIATRERSMRRERTLKGLSKAKEAGKVIGRPSISADIVEQIMFLFESQAKTLREISKITGVSLGTVQKYTSESANPV